MFTRKLAVVGRLGLCGMLLVAALAAPVTVVHAATQTVQSAADDGTANAANCPGAGCRLRDAIAKAAAGDTISFGGNYTILLVSQLVINKNLTITGMGHSITLSGNHVTGIFEVTSGTLALEYLTLTDGNPQPSNCMGSSGNWNTCGGAINIESGAGATVTHSTFANNHAGGSGAAIAAFYGTVTIENSTFSGNTSGGWGGAIKIFYGTMKVTNCTFFGNSAQLGGVFSSAGGSLTVINSTLSGNGASLGGSGIDQAFSNATTLITNTLIANSSAGNACYIEGGSLNGSSNLASDSSCGASFTTASSILLGPLGDYGGDTPTLPLLPGSAAIDAGDTTTCAAAPVSNLDQRGVARPQGARCDIGAFESRGFTIAKGNGDNQSTPIHLAFTNPLVITVTTAYTEPVNGGVVTFMGALSGASTNPITNTALITNGAAAPLLTANGVVGAYLVTASTIGAPGSASFTLTNLKGNTTTSLTSSPNPSRLGQAVTFTATVTSPSGTPTGTVTFYDNLTPLGSGTLNASGVATVTTASLTFGPHAPLTATYGSSASYTSSTSSNYSHTVNPVITPTTSTGGVILPGTLQMVTYGSNFTFTIAANTGYHVTDVGVDGVSQGAIASYPFTNVTANHILTAAFAINTYTLTPSAGAGGSITPGTTQTVTYGSNFTFTIAANTGYHVTDVGVDGVSQGAIASYPFTNVTANHTLTAAFALNCQTVQSPTFAFAPLTPLIEETAWFTGTVAAGSPPLTYTWAWDDGTTNGVGAAVSHAFPLSAAAHTYTVTLNVSNACSGPVGVTQAVMVLPRRLFLPLVQR